MTEWVAAPRVQVTMCRGQLRVASGATPELSLTDDGPAVLELLGLFRQPADPEEVLLGFEAGEAESRRLLIRQLAGIGALVPEAAAAPARPAPVPLAPASSLDLELRRRSLPSLRHDDLGLTVSSCGKEALSPGCQACKAGTWLCVFVGLRCNARCAFCPQPASARTVDEASFGMGWVDRLLEALREHGAAVHGLSLSGGEPFLYEPVAARIVTFVRAHLGHVYLWAYTNGLLANGTTLRRFRDYGLDEIRFNLAGCDFDPRVVRQVRDHAVAVFPWVSVEVPVYEATYDHLVTREALLELDDMGVRQLNLGQLFSGAPTSPAMVNFGDRVGPAGSPELTPAMARHRQMTYDIFELAYRRGLSIHINDCSHDAKTAQQLARARRGGTAMAALMDWAYPRPSPPPDLGQAPADAVRTASGLAYTTLAAGRPSRSPAATDSVVLRLVAWAADGRVVDTTYRAGLGGVARRVADLPAGLVEAVGSMREGERRVLWVPGHLLVPTGWAASPPLVLDLELVSVTPASPPC